MTPGIDDAPRTEESLPVVTVIVPTYNRAVSLADTLDGIAKQDYPRGLMDVVVVDNSSIDNTEDVVEEARKRSPFAIKYFRKENRGPAASRNYAIERSSSEILAFTDSDCSVAPDWVRRGVELMGPDVGLVDRQGTGPVEGPRGTDQQSLVQQRQVPSLDGWIGCQDRRLVSRRS